MDQSKERFPAVLVNASVPSLGCKANGGFESCISIHTSGYSVRKSQGRKVKEHVGPEFDAAQIEKWMSLHETGWQGEGILLSWSFPSVLGGPNLVHFKMLVIYGQWLLTMCVWNQTDSTDVVSHLLGCQEGTRWVKRVINQTERWRMRCRNEQEWVREHRQSLNKQTIDWQLSRWCHLKKSLPNECKKRTKDR